MSIRVTLALGFLIAALIGALAIGGAVLVLGRPALEAAVQAQLQDAADSAARALTRSLQDRRREIEFAANASEFRGPELDVAKARLYLRRLQEITPFYALVGFIDSNGRFLVTSNGLVEGQDVTNRDYWLVGKQHPYVSDAHDAILLAKSLGAPDAIPRYIDVAAPVFDGGRFLGVLVAHLSDEWAGEVGAGIAQRVTGRYPGARVDVLDASGIRVYGAASSQDASSGGKGAAAQADPDASKQLIARSSIYGLGPDAALHWSVRVSAERASALVSLAALRRAAVMMGLAALALAAALGWLLGSFGGRALEALALDAANEDRGGLTRFRRTGVVEIDDVGAALTLATDSRRPSQPGGA